MTQVLIGDNVAEIKERYLSPAEFALRVGLSRVTIYQWIYKGRLHAVHFGRMVRIQESEIQRIMQKREED